MTKPTKEQKGIWLNEFYEWYKDCFSIDEDIAEQVKTQMFADMRYAYIAAKKSDFEELQKARDQLKKCEKSLMKVACFETHGENKYINHEHAYTGVANFARRYFQDKENKDEK